MQGQRLATAEWMNPAEVVENYEYEEGQFFIGRSPADGTPLGFIDDRHICLVAGNRSGKGATTLVTNLCEWPGSVVVNDPKGENATVAAARRGDGSNYCVGMGQAVHVLDPFGESNVEDKYRSRFNPLDALDATNPNSVDEAGLLADALVTDISGGGDDGFFQIEARKIIKGLILHVLTAPDFEGRRNLLTVRDLITCGDLEGVALTKEMGNEDHIEPHEFLWVGVAQNLAFDGAISRIGHSQLDTVRTAPKQYAGARANAEQNTEFLDSPRMRESVVKSDFKLSDLKTDPKGVSIFLCIPSRMVEHSRWLRMMVTLTVSEMEATAGQPICGHRVLLAIDEFAGLGRLKVLEKAVAQLAGFGVKLFFVLQSLVQFKQIYGDGWEVFLSNAGLKLFFGVDDNFTCEYISKMLGETEVPVETESWNESKSSSRSVTDTTGRTMTEGQSRNVSDSTNTSRSTSTNQSHNYGQSINRNFGGNESTGENYSHSSGSNWSDSKTRGRGGGQNENENWKGQKFFFRNTDRVTHWLRENEGISRGENSNWNRSRARSRGGNESSSQGMNRQSGTSWNQGESTNFGTSHGSSESNTSGQGHTEGFGESSSTAESTSQSKTDGTTTTEGKGGSVTLQKRPLATIDELRFLFDRIEEGGFGWCLVLAGGKRGMIASRCRYFEDRIFAFHYDPHPDHTAPPLLEGIEKIALPDTLHPRIFQEGAIDWKIAPGQEVERGQGIATVKLPAPTGDEGLIFKKLHPEFPLNAQLKLNVISTMPGKIAAISHPIPRLVAQEDKMELASLEVNRRRVIDSGDNSILQPLNEYSEFLEALPDELEKLAEERSREAQRVEEARLTAEKEAAKKRAVAERLAKEKAEAEERERERLDAEWAKKQAAEKQREYEVFIEKPGILNHPWPVGFGLGISVLIISVKLDVSVPLGFTVAGIVVTACVLASRWWKPVQKARWHCQEHEETHGAGSLSEARNKFMKKAEEEWMGLIAFIALCIVAGPTALEWFKEGYSWPGFKSLGIGLLKCWLTMFPFAILAWGIRSVQWYLGGAEEHFNKLEGKENA